MIYDGQSRRVKTTDAKGISYSVYNIIAAKGGRSRPVQANNATAAANQAAGKIVTVEAHSGAAASGSFSTMVKTACHAATKDSC